MAPPWLLHGAWGLVEGVISLALLGFGVLLIRRLTPGVAAPPPVRRQRLEWDVALGLLALLFMVQLLDFNMVQINPFSRWVQGITGWLYRDAYGLAAVGVPPWAFFVYKKVS